MEDWWGKGDRKRKKRRDFSNALVTKMESEKIVSMKKMWCDNVTGHQTGLESTVWRVKEDKQFSLRLNALQDEGKDVGRDVQDRRK